jgi:hypothetical protein
MNLGGGLNQPGRYQRPPRSMREGTSLGRSRPEPSSTIESRPDRVLSIFERAVAGPVYDANRQAWDEALALLNLRPCYQPAIAKVLGEGRWRDKKNPRAYVATAAARQALAMRLPDFSDRGFCRVSEDESEFDSGEQATRRHSLSPLAKHSVISNCA